VRQSFFQLRAEGDPILMNLTVNNKEDILNRLVGGLMVSSPVESD
jgi:hypothetical protein